jgi:hypothetical protein
VKREKRERFLGERFLFRVSSYNNLLSRNSEIETLNLTLDDEIRFTRYGLLRDALRFLPFHLRKRQGKMGPCLARL